MIKIQKCKFDCTTYRCLYSKYSLLCRQRARPQQPTWDWKHKAQPRATTQHHLTSFQWMSVCRFFGWTWWAVVLLRRFGPSHLVWSRQCAIRLGMSLACTYFSLWPCTFLYNLTRVDTQLWVTISDQNHWFQYKHWHETWTSSQARLRSCLYPDRLF